MNEREYTICIGIHHIATIVGLLNGIDSLITRKAGKCRCLLLIAFVMSQSWAFMKIIFGWLSGKSRLRESICHICSFSENPNIRRQILWSVTLISTVFKLMTPGVLRTTT